MLCTNLIRDKREGRTLDDAQWQFLIEGYCRGTVAEPQMAAMAMAICLRGMTIDETASLTRHMHRSGISLPRVTDRPRVDKHSTGGLGDKVSLILAPLLACCDVDVPMISGRGLGRTGGTLDKLESIEGFQVSPSIDESSTILKKIGTFIISANEQIAPADRKLYALRDVTATVESVGLITASILSKKLSASLDALVMDVKVGSGGFMPDFAEAKRLARSLVDVGGAAGLPVLALLTDMDQPLGRAVGNAVEVNESLDVLGGGGPARVRELTIQLCARLLVKVGVSEDLSSAIAVCKRNLDNGLARERFEKMVAAQGGRLRGPLKLAPSQACVADQDGWIAGIDCPRLGDAIIAMGGGRRLAGDSLDHRVGVTMHVEIGDRVERGQPLFTVHHDRAADWLEVSGTGDSASFSLAGLVTVSPEPVASSPLIVDEL